MPDWLPSALIAVTASVLIAWLVELVAPGAFRAWLSGQPGRAGTPRRKVSGRRTIASWGAVVLAVLALVWLLTLVFSRASP